MSLDDIRRDYSGDLLPHERILADPFAFLEEWLQQALQALGADANAVTLATADAQGFPHARIVLVRGIADGALRFFTNYNSDKGQQLAEQPRAAMSFFWPQLDRQIRIEGEVIKLGLEHSRDYFAKRPHGSQLAALASAQSEVLSSRQELIDAVEQLAKEYQPGSVPRPEWWGGYGLQADYLEFWQGMPSRMHDRFALTKRASGWEGQILAP